MLGLFTTGNWMVPPTSWVRESKGEKVRIKYLAARGFGGCVAALDDGFEPCPL